MAIDQIARAMAASSGGGAVGFITGDGLHLEDGDPKTLVNDGILTITESDEEAEIGTFHITYSENEEDIKVKGFNTAGTKTVDTEIDDTATQTGLPTTEAVKDYLESYGDTVKLSLNPTTYVLTAQLKHGTSVISSTTVDLPLESMVISARYDADTKKIILTLQSGDKIEIPISQLISGLVPDSRKIAGIDLTDDITVAELNTALGIDSKIHRYTGGDSSASTRKWYKIAEAKLNNTGNYTVGCTFIINPTYEGNDSSNSSYMIAVNGRDGSGTPVFKADIIQHPFDNLVTQINTSDIAVNYDDTNSVLCVYIHAASAYQSFAITALNYFAYNDGRATNSDWTFMNTAVTLPSDVIYSNDVTMAKYDTNGKDISTELSRTVKKAQIVPVESTANVVTVPSDSVGDYSAIAKIGGKTVKSKNLLVYPYNRTENPFVTNTVTYTVNTSKEIIINATELPNTTTYFDIRKKTEGDILHLKVGKTYTISYVCTGTGSCGLYFASQGTTDNIFVSKTISEATNGEKTTFTYTRPENYEGDQIFVSVGSTHTLPTNLKVTLQIEEGSEATVYEPYFEGLHSAPVDKIVSSKVLTEANVMEKTSFDKTSKTYRTTNSRSITEFFEVKAGNVINFSAYSLANKTVSMAIVCWDNQMDEIVDTSYIFQDSGVYTIPNRSSKAYIILKYTDNTDIIHNDIIFNLNYVINELSLTDLTKSLPDYGCSAGDVYNYIDFERGVYVHQVTENKHMENWNWQMNASHQFWYSFTASDNVKPSSANIICGNLDTVQGTLSPYSIKIGSSSINVNLNEDSSLTVNALKEYLTGTSVVYELNVPEEIPLSNFIPIIKSEPNGTIEFHNEHNLAVPNKVLYKKEVL